VHSDKNAPMHFSKQLLKWRYQIFYIRICFLRVKFMCSCKTRRLYATIHTATTNENHLTSVEWRRICKLRNSREYGIRLLKKNSFFDAFLLREKYCFIAHLPAMRLRVLEMGAFSIIDRKWYNKLCKIYLVVLYCYLIFTPRCYAERGYATVSRLPVRDVQTVQLCFFHTGWNNSAFSLTLRVSVKWVLAFGLSNDNKWRWWIRLTGCLYRRACGSRRLAWSKGRRPPGAVSVFIARTEWTLAVAPLRWTQYKYRRYSLLLLLLLLLFENNFTAE